MLALESLDYFLENDRFPRSYRCDSEHEKWHAQWGNEWLTGTSSEEERFPGLGAVEDLVLLQTERRGGNLWSGENCRRWRGRNVERIGGGVDEVGRAAVGELPPLSGGVELEFLREMALVGPDGVGDVGQGRRGNG